MNDKEFQAQLKSLIKELNLIRRHLDEQKRKEQSKLKFELNAGPLIL